MPRCHAHYIKKNVFNNLFNTLIDIKGKSKDNVKGMMDLKEYCKWIELELVKVVNDRIYKPKAKFLFGMEQKHTICEWVKKKN